MVHLATCELLFSQCYSAITTFFGGFAVLSAGIAVLVTLDDKLAIDHAKTM